MVGTLPRRVLSILSISKLVFSLASKVSSGFWLFKVVSDFVSVLDDVASVVAASG